MAIVVIPDEAFALKALRGMPGIEYVRNVLERELQVTREQNESEPANEERRLYIQAVKRTIAILFEEELVRG